METIDCEQRSEEWYQARLGIVTASCFKHVLSKGAARKKYMEQLIEERISGEPTNSYANKAMQNGIAREADALVAYEKEVSLIVEKVGFLKINKDVGCSPDGLVGDTGGVEIKCPTAPMHGKYIAQNRLPSTHRAQVQGNLWVTGRLWWDFVSYYPEKPLFIKRVYTDACYIEKLHAAVNVFIQEMLIEIKKRSTDMNFQAARNAPGQILRMQGIVSNYTVSQGNFGPYGMGDLADTAGEIQKTLITVGKNSTVGLPGPECNGLPAMWGIKFDANNQNYKAYFNGYAGQQQVPPQQYQQPAAQAVAPQYQPPPQAPQNYPQMAQSPPQATQPPQVPVNAERTSIERQVCVKGACAVAAGVGGLPIHEVLDWCNQLHQWIRTGEIPYSEVASADPIDQSPEQYPQDNIPI
jgi:hypothetical protein